MTINELKELVQTYRYKDAVYVVVDSLPQPHQGDFLNFLRGSACPVGDGVNRYAYVNDFDRWLATLSIRTAP